MSKRDSIFYNNIKILDQAIQLYRIDSTYSTSKSFGIDQGLCEIKAYLNVKHAYTKCKYGNVQSYDTSVNLPISSSNTVSMNDLYGFYITSKNRLNNWFIETRFEDKGLVSVSLSQDSLSTTNVVVKLHAVFGSITTTTFDYGTPFGDDDDWKWGKNMGYCDYSNPGLDASDKIEEVLNANHLNPFEPAPGYKLVYVPNDYPEELNGNEYPDDDPIPDNFEDYLIFYCSAEGDLEIRENIEECLEDNEMNFYYNGESKVVYELLPTDNPNLGWFIVGDLIDISTGTGNSRVIRHKNNLTFGQYYIILDPDIAFNEDPFATE